MLTSWKLKSDQVEKLLNSKRVIICCGSGGVGKTTSSAALAIKAATTGKKVVVVTIDPAKRLATSLGLKSLSDEPTNLTSTINEALSKTGAAKLSGEFWAVMPDTARTFDRFVRSMAGKNENLAARILKTSIYKVFSQDFSGSNEYMAMEKLYSLYANPSYDLIVLDTPPAANTRSFLDAPATLAQFFDDKLIKWIVAPGSKILASGMRMVLDLLEKMTGQGFISDLVDFTTALLELKNAFAENLQSVIRLFRQNNVAFLMVTSPERLSKEDTQGFVQQLRSEDYPFWGFIINRVVGLNIGIDVTDPSSPIRESAFKNIDSLRVEDETLKMLEQNFETVLPLLEREQRVIDWLKHQAPTKENIACIPTQNSDVHSIESLYSLSQSL